MCTGLGLEDRQTKARCQFYVSRNGEVAANLGIGLGQGGVGVAKMGDRAAVDIRAGTRAAAASRGRDAEVVLGGVDWTC